MLVPSLNKQPAEKKTCDGCHAVVEIAGETQIDFTVMVKEPENTEHHYCEECYDTKGPELAAQGLHVVEYMTA